MGTRDHQEFDWSNMKRNIKRTVSEDKNWEKFKSIENEEISLTFNQRNYIIEK